MGPRTVRLATSFGRSRHRQCHHPAASRGLDGPATSGRRGHLAAGRAQGAAPSTEDEAACG